MDRKRVSYQCSRRTGEEMGWGLDGLRTEKRVQGGITRLLVLIIINDLSAKVTTRWISGSCMKTGFLVGPCSVQSRSFSRGHGPVS